MLARRFAAAIGLLVALMASQLPEYVQQYRQRLGGAVDELRAIVDAFDAEAARESLDHSAALARLASNPDVLVRDRASSLRETAEREARLSRQEAAFRTAGPVSQYLVLLDGFDPRVGQGAYAAYQPAVPVTTGGIVAGLVGLFGGWGATHLAVWAAGARRRTRREKARVTAA